MPDDGLGVSDDRVGGILGPGGLWMSRTSGILFFTICSLHISGIFRDVFLSNKIFFIFQDDGSVPPPSQALLILRIPAPLPSW